MNGPVVELEAGSPVGGPQQGLQGTGQVHKHVAHQEEPAGHTQAQKVSWDGTFWIYVISLRDICWPRICQV